MKVLVWPVTTYGCESWTYRKNEWVVARVGLDLAVVIGACCHPSSALDFRTAG